MMLFSIVQNRFLNRYLVRSCVVFVVLFFLLQQFNASNVLAAGLNEEIGQQIPHPHPTTYRHYLENEIEATWQIINKSHGELKALEQRQSQIIKPFRDANELKEKLASLEKENLESLNRQIEYNFKKQENQDKLLCSEETAPDISIGLERINKKLANLEKDIDRRKKDISLLDTRQDNYNQLLHSINIKKVAIDELLKREKYFESKLDCKVADNLLPSLPSGKLHFRDVVKQIMPIINYSSLVTTKSSKLEQLIAKIDIVDDLLIYKIEQRRDRVRSISSDDNKSLWKKIIETIMPCMHRKLRAEYITQMEGLSQIQQLLTMLNNLPSALQFSETLLTQVLLDQNVSVSLRDNNFELFAIQLNEAIEDIEIFMNDLTSLINPESIAQEENGLNNDGNEALITKTQIIVNNLESLISIAKIMLTPEIPDNTPNMLALSTDPLIHPITQSPALVLNTEIDVLPYQGEPSDVESLASPSQNLVLSDNISPLESYTQPKFNDRELVNSENGSLDIGCVNEKDSVTRDHSQSSLQDELEAADPTYRKKRSIYEPYNTTVDPDKIFEDSFGLETLFEEKAVSIATEPQTLVVEVVPAQTLKPPTIIDDPPSQIVEPTLVAKIALADTTSVTEAVPLETPDPTIKTYLTAKTDPEVEVALVAERAPIVEPVPPPSVPPPPEVAPAPAVAAPPPPPKVVPVEIAPPLEIIPPEVAPVEVIPVEAAPAVAAPVEAAPVEAAPVEAAPPLEVIPPEVAPAVAAPPPPPKVVPVEVAPPLEIIPPEVAPVEVIPVEAAPVEAAPPLEVIPPEVAAVEADPPPPEVAPVEAAPPLEVIPPEAAAVEVIPVEAAPAPPAPAGAAPPPPEAAPPPLINSSDTEDDTDDKSKLNFENQLEEAHLSQSDLSDQTLTEEKPYIPPVDFDIENNIARHTTPIEFDYLNLISNALSIRNNILQHNFENVVEAGDNDYYIGKRGGIQFVRSITKQKGNILAFKNNQQGFILGFNVQPLDKLIIGIAYATASSSTKFQSICNDQQNTTLHVGAIYSKYTLLPNIYLNSYLKYGKAFIQNLGRREGVAVYSKTKGDVTRAKLETYYELKLDKFLFKPIVGIIFDHFLIKNFTEYRKEFNINIPTRKGKRILLETGIGLSKTILVKNISIIPEVHLKLDNTLLLKNSTDIISFTSTAHQIQTIAPISQSVGFFPKNVMYTLGGYVNMQSVLALELAAGYDYSFRKNFTTHSFYINGLVKF